MGIKYRILQNKNGEYFYQRRGYIFWFTPPQGEFDSIDRCKLAIERDKEYQNEKLHDENSHKIKKIVEIIE
jgi:hypothetical protein